MLPSGAIPRVFLWEDTSGDWVEHVLADVHLGLHDFLTGDVEGDGDIDIVAKVWRPKAWGGNANNNNEHIGFWENLSHVDLDNGEDLKGWTVQGGRWTVEDGVIIAEQEPPGSGNGGVLIHDVDSFEDFELIIDVWPDYGVDTGVYFRMNHQDQGYQLCIDYQPENPMGQIYGVGIGDWNKWSAAWDFTVVDETTILGDSEWFDVEDGSTIWHAGDWNHFLMKVSGSPMRMQVWINDAKIYDYTDPETLSWTQGSTQLQVHDTPEEWPEGSVAQFRNLAVNTVVGP